MKNIIFDNYDNMIGFDKDILEYVKNEIIRQLKEDIFDNVNELGELLYTLYNDYDYSELLKVSYNAMGGYNIVKLEESEVK